jgi:hypothetical protein
MKKIPKILKSIFLLIFICQMIGLIVLLIIPALSQAADPIMFKPQVGIGTDIISCSPCQGKPADDQCWADCSKKIGPTSIGEYIQSIYKYAIGIVGILAAVVLMMGGVIWLTAGGNQTRVGEAKSWIGASLTGLIIALTSYLILATVNPALVQFRPIEMATVESFGCCDKPKSGGNCSITVTEDECEASHFYKGSYDCNESGCVNKNTTVTFTPTGSGCCEYEEEVVGFNLDQCANNNSTTECNTVCSTSNGKYINCGYTDNKRCSQKIVNNIVSDTQPCVDK